MGGPHAQGGAPTPSLLRQGRGGGAIRSRGTGREVGVGAVGTEAAWPQQAGTVSQLLRLS